MIKQNAVLFFLGIWFCLALATGFSGLFESASAQMVAVDARTEESEFGKFGWIMDPKGN